MHKHTYQIKGICIIAVLLMHSLSYYINPLLESKITYNELWSSQHILLVFDYLLHFAVPIFLALSGYFVHLKITANSDYINKLKHKSIYKLLPIYFYSSISYLIFHHMIWGTKFNLENIIYTMTIGSSYHLYYLYVIVLFYLISPVINKHLNKFILYSIILFFTMPIIKSLVLYLRPEALKFPEVIPFTMFFIITNLLIYYVIGFYLFKTPNIKKILRVNPVLVFVVLALSCYFGSAIRLAIINDGPSFFINILASLINIITNVSAYIIIYKIIILIENKKMFLISESFALLGKKSLSIFVLHVFFLQLLGHYYVKYQLPTNTISFTLISLIFSLFSCLVFIIILEKMYKAVIKGWPNKTI